MITEQLESIHHIAISVRDISVALDWYLHNFQCKVEYQDSSWALLKFRNIRLALVLPDMHPPHLAFIRNNLDSHDKKLKHRDDSISIYMKDPDGNYIELIEKKSL